MNDNEKTLRAKITINQPKTVILTDSRRAFFKNSFSIEESQKQMFSGKGEQPTLGS